MATLSLQNIEKRYAGVPVIRDLSLDIADREFVVFVGPSGCGKSTLIRMIAGLEALDGGTLRIDGERMNDVGPADRGLAMVFQSYALYPHMTVRQNMGFALRLAGVTAAEREHKVVDAARILHLENDLDRKPGQLSGGQRQRVAIGRAIVRNPKIFLFDEPLSNLDAALRGRMRIELARLHEDLAATMIYVTHDQVEAMTMADRIVVLRAGRIEQVGTPMDIYRNPANVFVAAFMGSPPMNLLAGRITAAARNEGIEVELAGGVTLVVAAGRGAAGRGAAKRGAAKRGAADQAGVEPGAAITLGIRSEHLRPDPQGPLAGVVTLVERLGALSLVHVDLGRGVSVIAQVSGGDPSRPHLPIRLAIDASHCHLFDETGLALALHPDEGPVHGLTRT